MFLWSAAFVLVIGIVLVVAAVQGLVSSMPVPPRVVRKAPEPKVTVLGRPIEDVQVRA